MADFPILTSPDGSTSINVGSVMLADGVDYGMAPMFANGIGGNPFADGGQLGFRYSGPRMFKFPIRLATVGNMTPAGVARALRQMAQPGAWIDLVLAGVATANAVRFDVIDGRVRETQDVKMWAGAGRREGVLELDVQPYGYLPTWITLASVASVAVPGSISIPGASILGDIPGLAIITAYSGLPSQQFGGVGTYGFDAFYYSMGNKAPAFVPPASHLIAGPGFGVVATLTAAADAPASQVQRIFMAPSTNPFFNAQLGWQQLTVADLNASYFGRYRLHALARLVSPSYGGAIPISADVYMSGLGQPSSFASGGLIASVAQPLTLASDGAYSPTPSGFAFYPLGDITIPTQAAAASQSGHRVRIWGNVPSTGQATLSLDLAGLWLQSLDGANGIITRDLQNAANPNGSPTYYAMLPFAIDGYQRDVQVAGGIGGIAGGTLFQVFLGAPQPAFSMADRYRGVWPQVSPSMTSIEIMLAARRLQVAYRNEVLTDTPKVWWRFNEPSGASVILDWSGNGVNGVASNMLLGASSLLYGEPGGATMATGFAVASNAAIPNGNAPRTIECWVQPATYGAQVYVGLGATQVATRMMAIELDPTAISYSFALASYVYAWRPGNTYHIAQSYSGTHSTLYVNGQAQGTNLLPAAMNTDPVLFAGNLLLANGRAQGALDEVAVYASALSANRILAHYLAGRNTQGATSPPVYHQGGFAGVAVRYQPRFAFQKEI